MKTERSGSTPDREALLPIRTEEQRITKRCNFLFVPLSGKSPDKLEKTVMLLFSCSGAPTYKKLFLKCYEKIPQFSLKQEK